MIEVVQGRHTTGCTFDSSCRTSLAYRVHLVSQTNSSSNNISVERQGTYLLAESLHIRLGQLFALHETLNPAVEGGDGRRFRGRSRRMRFGDSAHVLHIGIHTVQIPRTGKRKVSRDCDVGEKSVWGVFMSPDSAVTCNRREGSRGRRVVNDLG
jgi:hypothetical protein